MSTIKLSERKKFEELFEMSGGYVMDFTNAEFQEFIFDAIAIDIYSKYSNLSKAKILKAIISDFDNVTVGKLLLELLSYMQETKKINPSNQICFEECATIGKQLIGKTVNTTSAHKNVSSPNQSANNQSNCIIDYDAQLNTLIELSKQPITPQARGYAFEKYLFNLLDIHKLSPRNSFKIKGEQIDGSFILNNDVYLIEAKWTNSVTSKSDLVVFNDKVSSKSGFTRGVFISFAGYSKDALNTFSNGRTLNIVLLTVEELAIALSKKTSVVDVINFKTRALAEEGDCNKSILTL